MEPRQHPHAPPELILAALELVIGAVDAFLRRRQVDPDPS